MFVVSVFLQLFQVFFSSFLVATSDFYCVVVFDFDNFWLPRLLMLPKTLVDIMELLMVCVVLVS